MTTIWLIRLAMIAGLLLGYGIRWFHEKIQQAHRERIAHALGGTSPEWEKVARTHDAEALYWAANERLDLAAKELEVASLTRTLGKKAPR